MWFRADMPIISDHSVNLTFAVVNRHRPRRRRRWWRWILLVVWILTLGLFACQVSTLLKSICTLFGVTTITWNVAANVARTGGKRRQWRDNGRRVMSWHFHERSERPVQACVTSFYGPTGRTL
ncbi:hypothetical protein C8F04DRAFT_590819 [Mycena alexandri]|uniref:Uncharacterized protein n=1 Tax=Mycena alexandri TaxID=1745969 RepID=A0AAD6TFT3_9AGAR|nr:hypothetical protein C8F04DRAFT_590819 [Mycena alexandri]